MPTVRTRTIDTTARKFERVYLICPNGHEGTSAPLGSRTAQRLLDGDYSDEFCGFMSCEYWRGYDA